jgi:glycosyltransferase involved in cell wall biosynthesis
MRISVVMCSRNRAEQLGRVLETAAAMRVPPGLEWEMILVDNGSTDHTPDVVKSFSDRLPIRYVSEPKAGLSNARNRGVSEARGAYICWTDDDVMIDRNWLAGYAEAFDAHPEAGFFGGPVEPVLEGETPKWFLDNREALGFLLAARDLGPMPTPLSIEGNKIPFGANYAVRMKEQREHLYDPELGVAPQQKRLGEETAVVEAIAAGGIEGWWVPGSRVRHIIPNGRQTLEYVKTYQQSAGETWAYSACKRGDPAVLLTKGWREWTGVPLWMVHGVVKERFLFAVTYLGAPSHRWLEHFQKYAFFLGAIEFLRRKPVQ